jgi:hypothetical protein
VIASIADYSINRLQEMLPWKVMGTLKEPGQMKRAMVA